MINFFRKLRHELMAQKTGRPSFAAGRYLKYALGEIILVVIGILIALSINNWNNEQQLAHQEQKLLLEVMNDLKGTRFELREDIASINARIEATDSIIAYLDSIPHTDYDKTLFGSRMSWAISNVKLYPRTIAYENLKSLGIELVSNDSIRYRLSDFFDRKLTRVSLWENAAIASEANLYDALSPYFRAVKATDQEYKYFVVPERLDRESQQLFMNKLAILQNERFFVSLLYEELLGEITSFLDLLATERDSDL